MDELNIIFFKLKEYISLFYHHLINQKWSIFKIVVFFIVFYLIYGLIMIINYKEYIKKNWPLYKNKPYMLPFAGFFMEGDFFTNTYKNFEDFIYNTSKSSFDLLIKPIQYMFTIITKSIGDMVHTIDAMRKMAKVIRELFQKMIAEVFEQLTRSVSTLQFYQEKFRNLMKKQYAIFQLVYYYLETLRATFESMFNGPLPVMLLFLMMFGILTMFVMSMCLLCPIPFVGLFACPICVLCFDGDSLINIDNNVQKPIVDIVLGDIVFPNQKVIGTFIFRLDKPMPVYKLGDAYATGSHIYYDSNFNPERIETIKDGLETKMSNTLYCLATTHNLLFSGKQMFSDYYEISENEIDSLWNSNVMESLNNNIPEIRGYTAYPSGFLEIPSIKEKITGEINHLIDESGIELYEYNGIICSGNNIVRENTWIRVRYSSLAKKYMGPHNNRIVPYTTNGGILTIDNVIFRDFLETDDNSVYEWWNSMSLKYISKHIC